MAGDDGILVTFVDPKGTARIRARISLSLPVKRILPGILTRLQLPVASPDGTPLIYRLDHREGGRRLREEQTLPEAGVKDADHLVLFTEMVAG